MIFGLTVLNCIILNFLFTVKNRNQREYDAGLHGHITEFVRDSCINLSSDHTDDIDQVLNLLGMFICICFQC